MYILSFLLFPSLLIVTPCMLVQTLIQHANCQLYAQDQRGLYMTQEIQYDVYQYVQEYCVQCVQEGRYEYDCVQCICQLDKDCICYYYHQRGHNYSGWRMVQYIIQVGMNILRTFRPRSFFLPRHDCIHVLVWLRLMCHIFLYYYYIIYITSCSNTNNKVYIYTNICCPRVL